MLFAVPRGCCLATASPYDGCRTRTVRASQQNQSAHVRFGSKADIGDGATDVLYTPKSGHLMSAGFFSLIPYFILIDRESYRAQRAHSHRRVWRPARRSRRWSR